MNRRNNGQTLITNPLKQTSHTGPSSHYPYRTDFSTADMLNNRLHNNFCLFNSLFRSTEMKICWDFQSVFTSMVDASPSCKDVRSVMGQGCIQWNMNTMMRIFVASGQPPLKVRISKKNSNTILVHFIGRLFNILQTFANQWLPNFHINMTASFMASFLGSLYSQQRPLDKLWGWLHYTLTS